MLPADGDSSLDMNNLQVLLRYAQVLNNLRPLRVTDHNKYLVYRCVLVGRREGGEVCGVVYHLW